jgi:hypothetical protein
MRGASLKAVQYAGFRADHVSLDFEQLSVREIDPSWRGR